MKQKQTGFGSVEIILIIVAVAIVGFVGWRVYEASVQTQTTQDSTVSQGETPAPTDNPPVQNSNYETYTNRDLGVQFAYLKSWGKVTVETAPGTAGEKAMLRFTKNAKIKVDLKTPNYAATPKDSMPDAHAPGFTNYAKAVDDAQQSSTILATSSDYTVYAGFDCVNNNYQIVGITAKPGGKFAGLAVGYYEKLKNPAICNDSNAKVTDVLNKGAQKQITDFVKSVKAY